MRAILNIDLHLHGRVKAVEHLLGDFHSGKDALLLDEEFALAHLFSGDAAKGGMVSVTDVLGKGQVDESVVEFFY